MFDEEGNRNDKQQREETESIYQETTPITGGTVGCEVPRLRRPFARGGYGYGRGLDGDGWETEWSQQKVRRVLPCCTGDGASASVGTADP